MQMHLSEDKFVHPFNLGYLQVCVTCPYTGGMNASHQQSLQPFHARVDLRTV